MAHRKGWSQWNELPAKLFFSTSKKARTRSQMLEDKGYSKEIKKQAYVSYQTLFSEVMRNSELSEEEKGDILKQQGEALYQALVSCVKSFKTKITRDIIFLPNEKELEILPTEGGAYDWKKEKVFMISEIFDHFFESYDPTTKINLTEVTFSDEVEPELIGPIIGDRMYEHALTPQQGEQVISYLRSKAEKEEDEKGELPEFILFVKCSKYKKSSRPINGSGDLYIMLLSCTVKWYKNSNANIKTLVVCSPSMIGLVNGNDVNHCGITLTAPRNGIFLLNSAIVKNDKVL